MKKSLTNKTKSFLTFILAMQFFPTANTQSFVPSEIFGDCIASYNVMIARRKNVDQINTMTKVRDKLYSKAIVNIKIPEEELKARISNTTINLFRELNQKDTNAALTSSNQIWDYISFCDKNLAK